MRTRLFKVTCLAAMSVPAFSFAGSLLPSGIIANSATLAPGVAGGDVPFDDTGTFEFASIDANGRVYFGAQLEPGTYTATTITNSQSDRGYWSATSSADVAKILVDLEPAPNVPNAVLQRTTNGTNAFSGLASPARVSNTGMLAALAFKDNGSGTSGVTFGTGSNDSGLFYGTNTGLTLIARKNDPAPNTTGALINDAFTSFSLQTRAVNGSGVVAFKTTLTGGDVSGTTNNVAIYSGPAGAHTLLARQGDPTTGGSTLSLSGGFNVFLNGNSEVGYDAKLAGGTVTAADDSVLFINNTIVCREGDLAPGFGGGVFSGGALNVATQSYNNAGFIGTAAVSGGNVTGTTDDTGIFKANLGGVSLLMREGDAAGSTGGFFGVTNNGSVVSNNSGGVFFHNVLTGGSVTTADDSSYWYIPAGGSPQLAMREGSSAPDTVGAAFGALTAAQNVFNDNGLALIQVTLAGGDVSGTTNDTALYSYSPFLGLTQVIREGDTFNGKTVSSWNLNNGSNGEGDSQGLNNAGQYVLRLTYSDNSQSVVTGTILLPEPATLSLLGMAGALCFRRRA